MITLSCPYDEWLFVRRYCYIDTYTDNKKFNDKPKEKKWFLWKNNTNISQQIPFLIVDNDGIMINIENENGNWAMIPLSTMKVISLYYTVHPWSSLLFSSGDNSEIEEEKTALYFTHHCKRHSIFKKPFQLIYEDSLSLVIEHTYGRSQIPLPLSWLENDTTSFFFEELRRNFLLNINNIELLNEFF